VITFNTPASWCLDFTDEYMGQHLEGDYHICSVTLPTERIPGCKMVYIDAFEPEARNAVHPMPPVSDAINCIHNIDILLTRRPELLVRFPDKASKFVYGTTWIKDPNAYVEKTETVSYSMTAKSDLNMDGYTLRHSFVKSLNQIDFSLPLVYFESTRMPVKLTDPPPSQFEHRFLKDDKEPMFASMFSLIIENQRLPNYITEKLVDCIISKTVPLYFGCPNVSDYFDTDGMIIIKDHQHLCKVLGSLTAEHYTERIPAMERNFEKAQHLSRPLADRTIEAIKNAN